MTQAVGQGGDVAVLRADIAEAARVLSALGLVTAFGHVSARSDGVMLITPAADLASVTDADLVEVPLATGAAGSAGDAGSAGGAGNTGSAIGAGGMGGAGSAGGELPVGAPAEAWAHLAVYRARPDALAIARAQPTSAFAAAATCTRLLPLHGQAAWLGESVPVHDSAHLLRSAGLADRAAALLTSGEALLLRGNGAVTLGTTPGVAVARMWLLAAACEVWLAGQAAGGVTPLTAAEVDSWRAVANELLPRLWNHLRGVSDVRDGSLT